MRIATIAITTIARATIVATTTVVLVVEPAVVDETGIELTFPPIPLPMPLVGGGDGGDGGGEVGCDGSDVGAVVVGESVGGGVAGADHAVYDKLRYVAMTALILLIWPCVK